MSSLREQVERVICDHFDECARSSDWLEYTPELLQAVVHGGRIREGSATIFQHLRYCAVLSDDPYLRAHWALCAAVGLCTGPSKAAVGRRSCWRRYCHRKASGMRRSETRCQGAVVSRDFSRDTMPANTGVSGSCPPTGEASHSTVKGSSNCQFSLNSLRCACGMWGPSKVPWLLECAGVRARDIVDVSAPIHAYCLTPHTSRIALSTLW